MASERKKEILLEAESYLDLTGLREISFDGKQNAKDIEVSVIITTFGADSRLLSALNSVQSQDFQDSVEILISYDRGTVRSTFEHLGKWISDYWNEENTVRIVFHDNTTLFRDREMMISLAHGWFICFLDYDNTYYPNKINVQTREMMENKLLFSFSNQMDVDSNGNILSQEHLTVPSNYKSIKSLLFQNFVDSNTIMFDRKFLEEYLLPSLEALQDSFFDEIIEDYFYALLASATEHLSYIPIALGNYTFHSGNITSRLYESNTASEYIRIAWYNERVFKTLVAFTLINDRMKYCDGKVFSNFTNVISEEGLQILAVNSGMVTKSDGILLNLLRSTVLLFTRIPYINKRLRKRKDAISR